MTKGALEMGNEEYIIQWDDMTPEAKAKKNDWSRILLSEQTIWLIWKAWIRFQQISGIRL